MIAVTYEVKHKLIVKAIDRYGLLFKELRADADGVAPAPLLQEESLAAPPDFCQTGADSCLKKRYVKRYTESPEQFDKMVICIWQYFELLHATSKKLEDLWLNLLDVLNLPQPNKFTVFSSIHHQAYWNIILKDPLIKQTIWEAEHYKDSGLATHNPALYLHYIYGIRINSKSVERLYEAEHIARSKSLHQLINFVFEEQIAH